MLLVGLLTSISSQGDALFGRRKPKPPADDKAAVLAWMKEHFDRGSYRDVWEFREALGYEFVQEQEGSRIWFWVNAYPALAALRAGIKVIDPVTGLPDWPPLVTTSAGYADEARSGLGAGEDGANAEIAARFFG
jgi:hypothetical protein